MLVIKDLSYGYAKKPLFEHLELTFEANRIYGILGASGCGKSTLLRLMAGLIQPDKGEVIFQDKRLDKPTKEICMMHQRYTNFPWLTAIENVLFGISHISKVTKEQEEKAMLLLEQVGLKEVAHQYPHQLSGGMQQRLALARTLMNEPKILLMDEPLSALDPQTRRTMQQLLLEFHHQTKNTIIMVTHSIEEAKEMCDQTIQL